MLSVDSSVGFMDSAFIMLIPALEFLLSSDPWAHNRAVAGLCENGVDYSAVQRQTAVTAHFESKQLLLFVFVLQHYKTPLWSITL